MNSFRHEGYVRSINRSRAGAVLAAIAAATTLAFASPSQASSNVRVSGGVVFSNAGFSIRIGNACDTRVNVRQREFERGLAEGRCDGARDGFRDGLNDRCFEDHPRVRFNDASGNFIAGYKNGYACAYARAFAEGKQARCDRRDNRHDDRHDNGHGNQGNHGSSRRH